MEYLHFRVMMAYGQEGESSNQPWREYIRSPSANFASHSLALEGGGVRITLTHSRKMLNQKMSGNTKDKIAVCNDAGKTTPAATVPMANAYENATVLEKIENLAATFRHRKCNEPSSRFLFLNIKGNDKSYQTP
ncbi:hypothetical protein DY000_02022545 [Brassica cretica]|uniref:Uncharacterized protein n=1 Tax=Brassica cretica TaxID=69181 RepID=A0ABQ7ELY7_BRACR|nr:hypothetical protein DY000_02022545 [Brassica cretica]